MIDVIQNNWLYNFLDELKNSKNALLISPFVTGAIVEHLLSNKENKEIKLITRYNLNDFRSGVSDLSALKKLVKQGIKIKGIHGLHSKVYLFDSIVIIGSANFTSGGFFNNYEFGIKTDDNNTILNSHSYFDQLWSLDPDILSLPKIKEWEQLLRDTPAARKTEELPDFGKRASLFNSLDLTQKYFIKIFGKDDSRVDLSFTSKEEIEKSHCHWAITFSGKKGRPRKYNTGDIVYMARMLNGGDYSIFGKGIALKHDDKRDMASDEDIIEIEWKEDWPVYIRITNPEFIDGTMKDCPKLNDLINELKYDSFDKTQQRHLEGEENINALRSLSQQADVQLSEIGAEWLENKFIESKTKNGQVSSNFIASLYQGVPTINDVLNS